MSFLLLKPCFVRPFFECSSGFGREIDVKSEELPKKGRTKYERNTNKAPQKTKRERAWYGPNTKLNWKMTNTVHRQKTPLMNERIKQLLECFLINYWVVIAYPVLYTTLSTHNNPDNGLHFINRLTGV